MKENSLLLLKNVSVSLGEKRILKKVSFKVDRGEVVGIIGESGSGKTTLLKLIQGLLDKESGILKFKEKAILGPSEKLVPGQDQIATVYQDFQLQEGLTVQNNIKHQLIHYREKQQKLILNHLLRKCKMLSFKDKFPKMISGGMKQKVALAKALIDEPALILMDEPFSNLDFPSKENFKEIINELKTEGLSFIYVTHDVNDALQFSDRMIVLQKGKVSLNSTKEQVFKQVNTLSLAKLFALENVYSSKELGVFFSKKIQSNIHYWITPESLSVDSSKENEFKIKAIEQLGNTYRYELVSIKGLKLFYYSSLFFFQHESLYLQIDFSKVKALKEE